MNSGGEVITAGELIDADEDSDLDQYDPFAPEPDPSEVFVVDDEEDDGTGIVIELGDERSLECVNVPADMKQKLADRVWRLNNLYYILDKRGKKVLFQMNDAQLEFFMNMHDRNVILKARQMGFTTFIQVLILDACIFRDNIRAGVIAHHKDDAKIILRDKIKYAYKHLPEAIRTAVPMSSDSSDEVTFGNNSSIRVSTSMRSGTLQYLHVSEYGKIAAKYPEKAKEIKTGAFPAVDAGNMIFVESTAEGAYGEFYDMCKEAEDLALSGAKLTTLDFRFHFRAWWEERRYRLDAGDIVITTRMQEYFHDLEVKHGIVLDREQKSWYIKYEKTFGEDMKREYPSYADEAFEASIEGAYFSKEMREAREQGRVTRVPHTPGIPVYTWWDLGMNDENCIWFTQDVGREVHVIDYYANSGEGLMHYRDVLAKKSSEYGYFYGQHVAPHDIKVRELGTGVTRWETAARMGLVFQVVERPQHKMDSIQGARNLIPVCWFDEEKCDDGIKSLDAYRKEWDDKKGRWKDRPLHDEHSNPADAYQTLASGRQTYGATGVSPQRSHRPKPVRKPRNASGWT